IERPRRRARKRSCSRARQPPILARSLGGPMTDWTPARRAIVRSFCDTIFGSVPDANDAHGLFACKASDFGVDLAFVEVLNTVVPEPIRSALVGLLDALGAAGLGAGTLEQREGLVRAVAASSPDAAAGVMALTQIVLSLVYGLPDAQGKNPTWAA